MESNFKQFYTKIHLTETQEEDAKRKYAGVCEALHSHYYEGSKYDGSTKLLFGSYGKKTHIRPARDIDVIFKLPDQMFERYNNSRSNGQSQLLQDVKNVLKKTYPNTEIKADGKVVAVSFSEGSHNVEILPAWEQEGGTFRIPDSTDGGQWEYDFDPESEIKKIQDSENNTGNTRFLIRIIKKWSETCTANIKSYDIEQKVLRFFRESKSKNSKPELVRDFFQFACSSEGNAKLKSYFNTAYERAKKALDFEKRGDLKKASAEWRKIFGDDFPKSNNSGHKKTSPSPSPRPIDPATATPPYYDKNIAGKMGKHQITKEDLAYIKSRYVTSIRQRIYFLLKNGHDSQKIIERNHLHIILPFNRTYEEKQIKERYHLKIDFNKMEGGVLPRVFDTKKRAQKVAEKNGLSLEDMHVYEDTSLCITLPSFVKEKKMQNGFDLKIFFEDVLEEVLYWHAYYEKNGHEPWKALSHREEGVIEAVTKHGIGNRSTRRKSRAIKRKSK